MRRLAPAIALVVLTSLMAGPVRADTGTVVSFDDAIGRAPVVALVTVTAAPPTALSWVLSIDRAYRGPAGTLTIEPTQQDVPLTVGEKAVIAFSDPRSLDFRGTTAWQVLADGTLRGNDDIVDVPTLGDLDARFALGPASSATDLAAAGDPLPAAIAGSVAGLPFEAAAMAFVVAVFVLGLAAAGVVAWQRNRRRDAESR